VGFSTVSGCSIVTIVFTHTLQLHQTRLVLLQKHIHKNEEAQDKRRGGNIIGEQEETKEEEKAVGQSSSTNAFSRCLAR
jgi:hypothetical protein